MREVVRQYGDSRLTGDQISLRLDFVRLSLPPPSPRLASPPSAPLSRHFLPPHFAAIRYYVSTNFDR